MDALNMSHDDGKFDLVWACESGEHMPDKEKYVQEMSRVLKPGTHTASMSKGRQLLEGFFKEYEHPSFSKTTLLLEVFLIIK